MDTQLYLHVRGRVLGPYDEEKLQSLVRRGQLSRMHEVSTDGTHWVRASTYAELFVGAPVKLVVPEMQVAAPPPPNNRCWIFRYRLPKNPRQTQPTSSKPVIPVTTGRGWYYENLGTQHGPVEESVLRQMLVIGQLDSKARVWNDSMPQWVAASQVPGLIPVPVMNRGARGAGERSPGSEDDVESLCKAAKASRPWALFLAITAFVYAGLCILLGFLMLVHGADKGVAAPGRHGVVLDRQRRGDRRGRNPPVELRQPSWEPDVRLFVQGPGKRHGPAQVVLDVCEHCLDRDPGVHWVLYHLDGCHWRQPPALHVKRGMEIPVSSFDVPSGRGPMFRRISVLLLLLLLLLAGAAGYWWYASPSAVLSGQVVASESRRQPVPGAEISVVGTTRSVRTDSQGRFLLKLLPAGAIQVKVAAQGTTTAPSRRR